MPTSTRDNPNQGRVYDKSGLSPYLNKMEGGGRQPLIEEPCACLTPDRVNKRQNGRRFKNPGEPMFTLTKQDIHGVAVSGKPQLVGGIGEINFGKQYRQGNRIYSSDATAMCLTSQSVGNTGGNSYLYSVGTRIRRLTPRECMRLQGVPDYITDKLIAAGISDTQLYRAAGDACTVNVIYEIARRLS